MGRIMLLRSLTKHVRDQNWFAVALDFCIVVVGILIAFQITDWSETRTERQLESEYLLLLATDLKAIEANLQAQLDQEQEIIAKAKITIKAVNDRQADMDPLDIGHSLISIFGRRTLIVDSPIFSEMKSAGRLTLVEDTALRNRMIAYFDDLARVERILDKNNEFLVEPYTHFLRDSGLGFVALPEESCPNSNVFNACSVSRMSRSVFGSEETHAAQDILSVPVDDPFWANVRSQVVWRGITARANTNVVEPILADTQSLLEEVEATP